MPVFDQGYQHWNGSLAGHGRRWMAITRQGIRAQIKNRFTKYLIIMSLSPALVLVVFFAFWGLLEQKSDVVKPFLFFFQQMLPAEVIEGPRAFRASVWSIAFHIFYMIEVWVAVVLVLLVGPDLISQDLRFNATPLYFSRPLRRLDYFLGKLGVIVVFVGGVTVLPAALAYVVGVAFSMEWTVLADTWRVGLGAIGFGLVVAVVSGLVMLAFSSLSKNSRQVALLWLGLILVSGMVGGILAESVDRFHEQKPWKTVSFTADLHRVQEMMLGTEAAMNQLDTAFKESYRSAQRAIESARRLAGGGARRGLLGGLLGRNRRPGGPPSPPSPPGADTLDRTPPGISDQEIQALQRLPGGTIPDFEPDKTLPFLLWLRSDYPGTLSIAVLVGLALLSIVVLSTRVKSLDRLR